MNVHTAHIDEAELRHEAHLALDRILTRLNDCRQWSTQAFARNRYGEPVAPMDKNAARWDVVGAMIAETVYLDHALAVAVRALIRRTLMADQETVSYVSPKFLNRPGSDNLSVINDRIAHPELLDWLFGAKARLA